MSHIEEIKIFLKKHPNSKLAKLYVDLQCLEFQRDSDVIGCFDANLLNTRLEITLLEAKLNVSGGKNHE